MATIPSSGKLGVAQRASWAAGNQILSSLINFVLAVAVARSVSTPEFGIFALAFALYLVCLTLSRAVATEPLLIRYSVTDEGTWKRGVASATGTAITFGASAALICVLAGVTVGGTMGPALVVLGIAMVPLLLQDSWRYAFFSHGRGKSAFMNELLRTIVMLLSLAVVLSLPSPSVPLLILAWSSGAAAGAVAGMLQAKVAPRPHRALAWWREHHDIAPRLTVEGAIVSGAQYLTLFAVTAIAGLGVAGALRAGQVLMNALHIANFGLLLFGIPEAARKLRESSSAAMAFCIRAGAGLVLLALMWGTVLSFLPENIGVWLLGETWGAARDVIVPLAIMAAAEGAQVSAQVGLRAMARARESLRAMAVASFLILGGAVAGAAAGQQAATAAWGMAIGAVMGSMLWWVEAMRSAGKFRSLDHETRS